MKLLDKLNEKKQKMLEQIQRGKERSEQEHAEKIRRKSKRLQSMKPGVRKTMHEGLAMRKKPLDVMRDEYERRKKRREEKRSR